MTIRRSRSRRGMMMRRRKRRRSRRRKGMSGRMSLRTERQNRIDHAQVDSISNMFT